MNITPSSSHLNGATLTVRRGEGCSRETFAGPFEAEVVQKGHRPLGTQKWKKSSKNKHVCRRGTVFCGNAQRDLKG
jgi:hypothetical protein